MQLDRVIRREDGDWRLETVYLGQHVNFRLANTEMAALIGAENPSEASAVDALRAHKDDLDAAVAAVVGNDGTPPAKFSSLVVDPTARID